MYIQLFTGQILLVYSGLKLIKFGRSAEWIFLISAAVTLQDSKVRVRKFFKGFKYRSPSLVIREFETFSDLNAVIPVFRYRYTKMC